MNRAFRILQGLREQLEQYSSRIKRTAMVDRLEFETQEDGSFTVVAFWSYPRPGEHRISFTREKVLGLSLNSTRQRMAKRSCAYRDDIVRELLKARKSQG